MTLTGAEALVKCLAAERVSHAFGVAGGKLAPLLDAIQRERSIRYTGVRHEAAASMMAAAVRAGSGGIAVALGEMGPGSLNLASGAGTAFNNNLPVFLITTNQHRAASYPHAGMFMDLDTVALFKPITKWNAVVNDARRIPGLVRRAFREAFAGRPGPVHLDIPQDVLTQECEFDNGTFDLSPEHYRAGEGPRPAPKELAAAVKLLCQAKRPLIVAGGGVIASGAEAAVRQLAEVLAAPVVPSQMALGVVSSSSPYFIGHGGIVGGDAVHAAFADADVVIAFGCRFSSWMWDALGPLVRRQQGVINVNIDPAALGAAPHHDVALLADAQLALADILAGLAVRPPLAIDAEWLPELRDIRTTYERRLRDMAQAPSDVMHPASLALAIGEAMPSDALAVFDGGHTTFWSNDLTPVTAVRTRFHDPGMSHLGFGLPYAISLQLQYPDRPVFNITGDGSFGFTVQELDTARRYALPVMTVIHNNESWGIIRAGQRALDFELGTSLAGTDYAKIASGFGCFGATVKQPGELARVLEEARKSGLPAVIDCRTKFVPHPCLPAFGSMNRYGFDALTNGGGRRVS
jgi:acetolactate synthase-1/2/3 large subunit